MNENKKKVLVTGANGFIGQNLKAWGLFKIPRYEFFTPTKEQMDITSPSQVSSYFSEIRPLVVINLAAIRDPAEVENNIELAINTNSKSLKNIVSNSKKNQSFILQISSNYVFSGKAISSPPFNEKSDLKMDKLNVGLYGQTKIKAEKFLQTHASSNSAIVRIGNVTNCLVGDQKLDYTGKILEQIIKKMAKEPTHKLFNDQIISITDLEILTELLKWLIENQRPGVFHQSSTNTATPHEISNYISHKFFKDKDFLESQSIDLYLKDRPGRYPKNAPIDSQRTAKLTGIELRSWQESVDKYIHSRPNFKSV